MRNKLRKHYDIKVEVQGYLRNRHYHHVHPLFLNGPDVSENLWPLPASEHLSGHVRLRYQSNAPAPPEGMPEDKRDLYDSKKNPKGTYYKLIDEF